MIACALAAQQSLGGGVGNHGYVKELGAPTQYIKWDILRSRQGRPVSRTPPSITCAGRTKMQYHHFRNIL